MRKGKKTIKICLTCERRALVVEQKPFGLAASAYCIYPWIRAEPSYCEWCDHYRQGQPQRLPSEALNLPEGHDIYDTIAALGKYLKDGGTNAEVH